MAKVILTRAEREATRRQIEVVLASARSETNARLRAERRRTSEANALEADARKVGAAIRRAVREQAAMSRKWIGGSGGRGAGRGVVLHNAAYEKAAGFTMRKLSARGADGLSSFHFKWTSRGFGGSCPNRSRAYKTGEARKHIIYIVRNAAREASLNGGLSSNISDEPDRLTAFFDLLEKLEEHDRSNANVYCSIVVSLPHELDADQRAALFGEICSVLGRYDLPYVGANHMPDPDGDQRNYHGHLVTSLRPFRIVGDGLYEFSDRKSSDLNDASFIQAFRTEVAELTNATMARAGHDRRFTALSDAARGFAPRTKASGKHTIGAKNLERRAAELDRLRTQRTVKIERRDLLKSLADKIVAFAATPFVDFDAEIEIRRRRVQDRIAGQRRQLDTLAARLQAATSLKLAEIRHALDGLDDRLLETFLVINDATVASWGVGQRPLSPIAGQPQPVAVVARAIAPVAELPSAVSADAGQVQPTAIVLTATVVEVQAVPDAAAAPLVALPPEPELSSVYVADRPAHPDALGPQVTQATVATSAQATASPATAAIRPVTEPVPPIAVIATTSALPPPSGEGRSQGRGHRREPDDRRHCDADYRRRHRTSTCARASCCWEASAEAS